MKRTLITIFILFIGFSLFQNTTTDKPSPQKPESIASNQLPIASNEYDKLSAKNIKNNKSGEIEISIDALMLLDSDVFVYQDFISDEILKSEQIERVINNNSTSYLTTVILDGVPRPLTITISNDTVFASIPASDGTYFGKGNLDNIILEKAQPFNDAVIHDSEFIFRDIEVQENPKEPICINC